MTTQEIQQRQEKAEELFRNGFNCAQAVFAACADIYDIDETLALRLAASFGGGIGRMRQTCGAACGMFLLEGMRSGSTTPHDNIGKMNNYAAVQALAEKFKQENGSLICAELLAQSASSTPHPAEYSPQPEERTEQYYKKRPCVEMVRTAVKIYLDSLT